MRREKGQARPVLTSMMGLALYMSLMGCGGNNSLPQDVIDRARQEMQTALDAWKKGDSLAKLGKMVQMTDQDWKAGLRLLSYEVKRAEGLQGENVRCWVVLSLQNRQGKMLEKEVVYEIRLGDKTVIGRDPFY